MKNNNFSCTCSLEGDACNTCWVYNGPYEDETTVPVNTDYLQTAFLCNGCDGKGWVEVAKKPHKCPVCEGSGEKGNKFTYHPPVYAPSRPTIGNPPYTVYTTSEQDCWTDGTIKYSQTDLFDEK